MSEHQTESFFKEVTHNYTSFLTGKKRSYSLYQCPVCNEEFHRRGTMQHLSAKTRNSDSKHAKLYLRIMSLQNRRDEAKRNIKMWLQKHHSSLKMLSKL